MRTLTLLAVAATLALAGCVAETGDPGPSTASTESSALDGVTLEGAEVLEANASAVAFTWTGEAAPGDPVNRTLDVPDDRPFTAEATLEYDGRPDLVVSIAEDGPAKLCRHEGHRRDGAAGRNEASCHVTALAREPGTQWSVVVERDDVGAFDSQEGREPVPYTATVTVQVHDPEEVPDVPTLVPEAGDETVDPGWPEPEEASVRPGAKVAAGMGICTANFLFSTPDNASLFLGTASHCTIGRDLGDPVQLAGGATEGALVYCSQGAARDVLTCPWAAGSDDFALIEIPEEARDEVHPKMLGWGGPTGIADPSPGDRMYTYENVTHGDRGVWDPMAGAVVQSGDQETRGYFLPRPPQGGDSGSPVVAGDGTAIGTLWGFAFVPPYAGAISNLDNSLENLEEHTGRQVELATWPEFTPPEAPAQADPTAPEAPADVDDRVVRPPAAPDLARLLGSPDYSSSWK